MGGWVYSHEVWSPNVWSQNGGSLGRCGHAGRTPKGPPYGGLVRLGSEISTQERDGIRHGESVMLRFRGRNSEGDRL